MDGRIENVEKLARLFPDCVKESVQEDGTIQKTADLEALREVLGLEPEGREIYAFTWVGKKQAACEANRAIKKTLRPCREKSIDWDHTQNIYIEGDNLEALKLLQESYSGAVKMIYIDPPYNTGGDFIYADDFKISVEEYAQRQGYQREEQRRLFKNTDVNGRYHSDWCSMIYARLLLARNLLTDDGVICISIDDNEQANLRKICDEVFGERNFIAQCVRKRRDSQANLSRNISPIHEYVLIYAKKTGDILNKIRANIDESEYKNPDNDPRGPYKTMPCTNKGGSVYAVKLPSGKEITEEWRFKPETYEALQKDNRLVFPRGGEGKPRYKLFLSEKLEEGQLANTWLDKLASNQEATRELKGIFGERVIFDTPKPLGLLKFCLELATDKDSIVLDFFAGSCSTAHAVMEKNAEDGGNRKYIMIQIPEACGEKTEAWKQGYRTICDIGEERIRRVAEQMKQKKTLCDSGLRVFRIDSSNREDVSLPAADYRQEMLAGLQESIKTDRSPEDLLFGSLLEWGIPLSLPYRTQQLGNATLHLYDEGEWIACLDEQVSKETAEAIARKKPSCAIFLDKSFQDSSTKINVMEVFQLLAPDTRVRVL